MRYSDRAPNPAQVRRDLFVRAAIDKLFRAGRMWSARAETDAITEAFIDATTVTIPDGLVEDLEKVHHAGGFYSRKAIIEQALTALGFEVRK